MLKETYNRLLAYALRGIQPLYTKASHHKGTAKLIYIHVHASIDFDWRFIVGSNVFVILLILQCELDKVSRRYTYPLQIPMEVSVRICICRFRLKLLNIASSSIKQCRASSTLKRYSASQKRQDLKDLAYR